MAITLSKIVALLIAIGYTVNAILFQGIGSGVTVLLLVAVPLRLIWCPEWWNSSHTQEKTVLFNYTNKSGRGGATYRDSHASMLVGMGWFLLVGLPLVILLLNRR